MASTRRGFFATIAAAVAAPTVAKAVPVHESSKPIIIHPLVEQFTQRQIRDFNVTWELAKIYPPSVLLPYEPQFSPKIGDTIYIKRPERYRNA